MIVCDGLPDAAVGPGAERQHPQHNVRFLARAAGQPCQLVVHHRWSADLLMQGGLADHDGQLVPAVDDARLPAGQHVHRVGPFLVAVQGGVVLRDGLGVGGCLQEVGDELGLVDHQLGGGGFQDDVLPGAGRQDMRVLIPPALPVLLAGQGDQRVPLLGGDAVVFEQLPQFLGPDAADAGLYSADLGPVAVEEPGGLVEGISGFLAAAPQRGADQPPPDRRFSHGSSPSTVLGSRPGGELPPGGPARRR
jgi:hypothetical protein